MSAGPTFATIEPRITRRRAIWRELEGRVAPRSAKSKWGRYRYRPHSHRRVVPGGTWRPAFQFPSPQAREPMSPGARAGIRIIRGVGPAKKSVLFSRSVSRSIRNRPSVVVRQFPFGHGPKGFWLPFDVAPGSPVMPSRLSPLRSFLIRDPRKVRRTLVRPLLRGIRRHIVRSRNSLGFRCLAARSGESFVPFRQLKGDPSGRVVQAGTRKVIHRSPIWRWTKVDKPVIETGCAAFARWLRYRGRRNRQFCCRGESRFSGPAWIAVSGAAR
ncbi:hypothetical protein J2X37_002700 [Croceicoccus sp. BE223]|nr:hypothetical protein [Croceicoccus sp. BE223]